MISIARKRWYFFWQLLPLLGCGLFMVLYFIATQYYPGGNYLNKSSGGFSWSQNYWCNLLSDTAINGRHNAAQPIAFAAMGVLSLTLVIFWFTFPVRADLRRGTRRLIQASGFLAMTIGAFLFTGLHDTIINVAGGFGLIALAGTLIGLKKLGWTRLLYMGLLVLVLIGLNNLLYYGNNLMYYLPVVQKITFLYFLLWICLINLRWIRVANNATVATVTGKVYIPT
ncbi:MAG: hypothetical protein JWP69_2249 [Flaviaesturariibacter sp.]|nr:hypothetical protein [Flaviaesturariibacter sp.]